MSTQGSVLVIDDEANVRNTLSRILIKAGCIVTSACQGSEALQLIHNNNFDLIFLDLRLPDIHGIEMLRQIRGTNPHLPVIVLTGHGSINSAVEALHLEATDYLLKPVDPETLVSRTLSILEEQRISQRKREIQEQMTLLQEELLELEKHSYTDPPLDVNETQSSDSRFIKAGPFTLDLHARRVLLGLDTLNIPPSSFDYLAVLARHTPNVVRYQNLVRESQGFEAELSEARNLTRWHIHILRQAIEPDPKVPKYILNVRGTGYQFVVD